MYSVYVLINLRTNRTYVGQTSDLNRRLKQHNNNSDSNPQRYTKKIPGSWKLVHKEEYSSRAKAMRREKFLKSGQGRQWLKNLFKKPHFS